MLLLQQHLKHNKFPFPLKDALRDTIVPQCNAGNRQNRKEHQTVCLELHLFTFLIFNDLIHLCTFQMLGTLSAVPIKVPQVSSLHRLAGQAATVLPQVTAQVTTTSGNCSGNYYLR